MLRVGRNFLRCSILVRFGKMLGSRHKPFVISKKILMKRFGTLTALYPGVQASETAGAVQRSKHDEYRKEIWSLSCSTRHRDEHECIGSVRYAGKSHVTG